MLREPLTAFLVSTITLAAATSAFAAADIPGDKSTKAVLKTGEAGVQGTFEQAGDVDWYKVALKGGRNYAVVASPTNDGCLNLKLRTAAGKVLDTAGSYQDNDDGFEYRPSRNGTFFAEFRDRTDCARSGYPAPFRGRIVADARGDVTTDATIKVGQTINGIANWGHDKDYFRAQLQKGRSYTVLADGRLDVGLAVVDRRGRKIVDEFGSDLSATFKVPANGEYYVAVEGFDDSGYAYTVQLKTP